MKFVALETATEWCSVALWLDGEIVSLERRAGNRLGEFVLPMLESLFKRAGLGMADLDAIAFGAGPGAFTGLRIACGVAQGLAYSHNLPVIGVSTLEATAEESGSSRAVVALDARPGDAARPHGVLQARQFRGRPRADAHARLGWR